MRITELLTQETIAMDLSSTDKNGVIDELVNQLDKAKKLNDVSVFKELFITVKRKVRLVLEKVLRYHMPK